MNARHRKELRRFLKQWKVIPVNDNFKEAAERVNELIPALVEAITDEELDVLMEGFSNYLMTSIISPIDDAVDKQLFDEVEDSIKQGAN